MTREIIFTQNDLLEMLRGKEVVLESTKYEVRMLFYMEKEPLTIYENAKKTMDAYKESVLVEHFELVRRGLLSVKEFMEKHPEFAYDHQDLLVLAHKREVEKETLMWEHNKTDELLITHLTSKETRDLINGKKTINQIREAHGLPPINNVQPSCSGNKRMRWTYVYIAADGPPEDLRRFIQYVKGVGLNFDFFKQYDSNYEDFVVYCDSDEQFKQMNDCWKEIQKEYYDELNK